MALVAGFASTLDVPDRQPRGLRHLKRVRRWPQNLRDDEALEDVAAPEPPSDAVLNELLGDKRITPASRAVLSLHFQEGMTLLEVAAVLDIPVGTAKSRLAYGLATLRRHHTTT